ncbi:hypothetical protein [Methylotuvimicrobium sp. KM1]|uniref:hypothetical protein n=1 Tax=Methylotuvimicrobium sp. KM1 TaxID=3377707 RepID=UPI003850E0FE
MSPKKRFFIGGFGALMPVLVSLLAIDIGAIFDDESTLTTGNIIGVFIRYIILFLIGGFIAYLHEDEIKPFKLFEIGIAAPALISSLITAQSATATATVDTTEKISWSIIASAYAADDSKESSFVSDIFKGITGSIYRAPTERKTETPQKPVPEPIRPKPSPSKPENVQSIRLRSLYSQARDEMDRSEALALEIKALESELKAAKSTAAELEKQIREKNTLLDLIKRGSGN